MVLIQYSPYCHRVQVCCCLNGFILTTLAYQDSAIFPNIQLGIKAHTLSNLPRLEKKSAGLLIIETFFLSKKPEAARAA